MPVSKTVKKKYCLEYKYMWKMYEDIQVNDKQQIQDSEEGRIIKIRE